MGAIDLASKYEGIATWFAPIGRSYGKPSRW
jgi:hypothetical protein